MADKLGIDLIWFGVLLCVNMQTSFMHPPFGFALFYLRGISDTLFKNGALPRKVESTDIYLGAIPWVVMQLMLVLIVIFFPQTVTVFLDKAGGARPRQGRRDAAAEGGGQRRSRPSAEPTRRGTAPVHSRRHRGRRRRPQERSGAARAGQPKKSRRDAAASEDEAPHRGASCRSQREQGSELLRLHEVVEAASVKRNHRFARARKAA